MIKSRCVSFLFLLAFAISVVHTITPHSHPKANFTSTHSSQHNHDQHNHDQKNSHSHNSSDLPVFVHFSNYDFIGSPQKNLSPDENSTHYSVLAAPLFLFSVSSLNKLFVSVRKNGKPPCFPLPAVLSLRAPPATF